MSERLIRFPGIAWDEIEALPADNVTLWYVVSEYDGREVVSIQHVRLEA